MLCSLERARRSRNIKVSKCALHSYNQYYLRGGEETRLKLEAAKKREEEKRRLLRENAEKRQAEARRKELSAVLFNTVIVCLLHQPYHFQESKRLVAQKLEAETGIKWSDKFTDVNDDGNCQMHCVWLGLKTLIER